jgi:hypothetical protein
MKHGQKSNLIFLLAIFCIALSPPALSYDFIVPDTGQELCYDWERIICDEWHMSGPNQVCDSTPYCPEPGEDFYGQDAHYTINPPDLTDNGDGTVTDNLTQITWEQKTVGNEPTILSYGEATAYCENLILGGSDNWRLPTRREYSTILNLGTISPALDTKYFPHYTGDTPNDVYYWTSSEYHDNPTKVWRIQLSFGIIETASKTDDLGKARCVLANKEPSPNFTDNGNGTVTDELTGLMWEQKTDDGGSRDKDRAHTWLDALNYCEDLILGAFSDWRLPNPKELERIVDLSTSSPAADTTYFPNTNDEFYWTGTTCSGCHKHKAFSYDFSDGRLYFGLKKDRDGINHEHYTRCVRTAGSSGTTCPTQEIYGNASPEIRLLRNFRDTILSTTPGGQELIKLYYTWSPFLVQAMREDEELKKQLKETVDKILQVIDSR